MTSTRLYALTGLIVLLFNGREVSAQGTNATCLASFDWMDNSRSQNPCLMAAYLNSACIPDPTAAYVYSLPPDYHYRPPTLDIATPCQCSTVFYSMLSACAICQGRDNLPWSAWDTNCSTVYTGIYPVNIPSGTSIPSWAYLDVVTPDTFNVSAAQALSIQRPAESSAAVALPSSAPPPLPSSSASAVSPGSSTNLPGNGNTQNPSSSSHKSDTGAIVGGVVGGIGGAAIIAGLIAWLVIRNKRRGGATTTAPISGEYAQQPATPYHEKQYGGFDASTRLPSGGYESHPPVPTSPYSPTAPYSTASTLAPTHQPGQYTGVAEV